MVSDELVERIRERADLAAIVGEYTNLRRSGKSFRGPCPLHGGDGPNFSVDPERGIFKCFVCGEGGDVFGFLMRHLGLDFPTAVRQVGERVGIPVPDREERREDPHAHLREVAAFAAEWFQARLRDPGGAPARDHLERRGIALDTALEHGLGYAPDGWRELREAAASRGLEEEHVLELGLLATSERAEAPYDRFRHRLIFTIEDLRDRPIGFGGRDLGPGEERVPKYINSPDSPIFHKGEVLYGLNRARHAIRREGFAAVVEGYTDVLALHVRGLPVAVAALGTAFTSSQAATLARFAPRAYLLYDSDAPGLRATFRTADALLAAGVHPLVATLPGGEDPDSLVRARGPEALRTLLHDAVDVLERKLQILERKGYLENAAGRRRAVDGLLSTLRAVRDPALRDIYLDRAAERTGVRRETLVREVARAAGEERPRRPRRPGGGRRPGEGRPGDDPGGLGPQGVERNLLLLLLRDETLVPRALESGVRAAHFREPGYARLFAALAEADGAALAEVPDARLPAEVAARAEALRADATELTDPEEIFRESVRRLLHRPALERLREIDRALELADEGQGRELLAEKQRLAAELRAAGFPLSFLQRRSGAGSAVPDAD